MGAKAEAVKGRQGKGKEDKDLVGHHLSLPDFIGVEVGFEIRISRNNRILGS